MTYGGGPSGGIAFTAYKDWFTWNQTWFSEKNYARVRNQKPVFRDFTDMGYDGMFYKMVPLSYTHDDDEFEDIQKLCQAMDYSFPEGFFYEDSDEDNML